MPLGRNRMCAAAKEVKNLGLRGLLYLVPDLYAWYDDSGVDISNGSELLDRDSR